MPCYPDRIFFHIDGDAFFASCEQSTAMHLRGQPIVVGRERGIATAYSYQAKQLGVTRAMPVRDIQKQFPQVVMVSSDYRKYTLFSQRMKRIIAGFGLVIEGDSIDECFADVTTLVNTWQEAAELADKIQDVVSVKLGLTVSVGVGRSRVIAKIASGLNKPHGVTVISPAKEHSILHPLPVGLVGGVGLRTEVHMNKRGVFSIGDFLSQSEAWVSERFSKPCVDLYRQLQGNQCDRRVELLQPKSVSKIRAFAPATSDKKQLLSEFARNSELVAQKLESKKLESREIVIGMKSHGHNIRTFTIRPDRPVGSAVDLVKLVNQYFSVIYQQGQQYRATFIGVYKLRPRSGQVSLFVDSGNDQLSENIESLRAMCRGKFGSNIVHTAASLDVRKTIKKDHKQESSVRGTPLLYGADKEKVLYLPYLGSM